MYKNTKSKIYKNISEICLHIQLIFHIPLATLIHTTKKIKILDKNRET